MRDADFGPWQHHGNQLLPPKGVRLGDPVITEVVGSEWGTGIYFGFVSQLCDWSAVIRYRVRRPAGLALLEAIARDPASLPAADREGVQA